MQATFSTDIQAFEAAWQRVGLEDATAEEALSVSGPELADWIEGVISRPLPEVGHLAYALMLTPKATRVSDFWAWRRDLERVLLEPPQTLLAALMQALERFRISARVAIEREPRPRLELVGPLARAALTEALGFDRLAPAGQIAEHDGLEIALRNRHGIAGVSVTGSRQRVAELQSAVGRSVGELGGGPLTPTAASWLRIARCHPDASDVGADRFIAETPLFDRGVDLSKRQAFIGMQPLLRVSHRGHVNRRTVGLVAGPDAAWHPDERIELEGKNVGTLGPTGFVSPLEMKAALAYIRTEVKPGEVVAVGDGPTYAEVREAPILEAVDSGGP